MLKIITKQEWYSVGVNHREMLSCIADVKHISNTAIKIKLTHRYGKSRVGAVGNKQQIAIISVIAVLAEISERTCKGDLLSDMNAVGIGVGII